MKIKGLVTIYAGAEIHPPGAVFTINDTEGQSLIERGFAEAVAAEPEDEPAQGETRRKK
jgi:hypothetical protein